METPEETNQTPAPAAAPQKVKKCLNCGNDFHYKLETAQYCSGSCRATHSKKNRSNESNPVAKTNTDTGSNLGLKMQLSGLPPHATYIIAHQETVIADWKRKYEEERADAKELKQKYRDLKEKMAEEKRAQELKGLEDSRPSLFDQIATVVPEDVRSKILGALADMVIKPAAGGAVAGVEGQADPNWEAIQKWYAALPPNFQQKVFQILSNLAMIQESHQFELKTTQIINLLSTINKMRNGSSN